MCCFDHKINTFNCFDGVKPSGQAIADSIQAEANQDVDTSVTPLSSSSA